MTEPNVRETARDSIAPAQEGMGLTSEEAARRLSQFGPNSVASVKERPIRIFFEQLWAPVPWMLEAAVVVQASWARIWKPRSSAALLLFNAAFPSSSAAGRRPPWSH